MERPSSQKLNKGFGEIEFLPGFYSLQESVEMFEQLEEELNWKVGHINLFGKTIAEPRLSTYYGDKDYVYSRKRNPAQAILLSPALLKIQQDLKERLDHDFNAVLANYYRDGKDSMSWHSDDEAEHQENSMIASLSFGETRRIRFRMKKEKKINTHIELNTGSLLLMKGRTQYLSDHCIPKQRNKQARINLTFRQFSG